MSPPAAKRDELVTVLLERLDRFEAALSAVRDSVTRIEAAEEQSRSLVTQAHLRADAHEGRISLLEASKHRAEGAAWAARIAWVALAAGAGAASHFLLGK